MVVILSEDFNNPTSKYPFTSKHDESEVLFMAMPLSVLGNAMSQTWADRHRIVLITQARRKLKNLGYTAEHMPKLFLGCLFILPTALRSV